MSNTNEFKCPRIEICEDTFDSMAQVMPMFASVIDVTGMTPAMAAHQIVMELEQLRKAKNGSVG